MISIKIEREQLQNSKVFHATLDLLNSLAEYEGTSNHETQSHSNQQILTYATLGHSFNKNKNSSALHQKQPYYHLPVHQLTEWVSKLSPLQARFVLMLQSRTSMTLEEIEQELPLQLDPHKNKIKQINGFIGVIARWSTQYYQGLGRFRVPWECKNQVYYWREDLLVHPGSTHDNDAHND
jgi:hypothetical protein